MMIPSTARPMLVSRIALTAIGWMMIMPVGLPAQDDQAGAEEVTLAERQERLADNFRRLEQKLFDLYEFELDQNPDRSRLLRNAYELSQNRRIARHLETIAGNIKDEELRPAISGQKEALEQLRVLLELLQNEDQSKQLEEDQKRIEGYIEEVERLLRIQQGIRGQAEGGIDPERLSDSQGKAAERTGRLADEIRENESGESPDGDRQPQDGSTEPSSENGQPSEGTEPGQQGQPGDQSQAPNSEGSPEGSNEGDGEETDQPDKEPGSDPTDPEGSREDPQESEGSQTPPENESGDPSDSPPGDSPMPMGQPSDSPPQEGGEPAGQQGQSGQPNPVQQRVEEAQKRMREAQQRLDQAQRDESIKEMREAEEELAKAKEELEEILRQLREEEVDRTLEMLEARIREMLDRELRIADATEKLNAIAVPSRGGEFHIQSGKLSTDQMSLALEADRLLMILQEEGSSIAFPETVAQIRDDMEQVAVRLREAKVDPLTIGLETEIIESLEDLINALVAAQEQNEQEESPPEEGTPSSPPPPPGEQPLVNQLEELKLIRNLQVKINKRHDRYSTMLTDPEDPIGYTTDPELQSELERLSDRQRKLQRITREIVYGSQ